MDYFCQLSRNMNILRHCLKQFSPPFIFDLSILFPCHGFLPKCLFCTSLTATNLVQRTKIPISDYRIFSGHELRHTQGFFFFLITSRLIINDSLRLIIHLWCFFVFVLCNCGSQFYEVRCLFFIHTTRCVLTAAHIRGCLPH